MPKHHTHSDELLNQSNARLELDKATVSYNGQPILKEISFQIPHGARLAVVGPNGAGKSTLFKALVGLLPLRAGKIFIHGLPLGAHKDCVAYVPQREEVDWRFPVTVLDVVLMGRFAHLGWLESPSRQDIQIARSCLEQMGIAHLEKSPIGELSGGQQQRVFLARALAQQPHILLLDEPFTGVDAVTQQATLHLLDHLRDQGVTTLVSTHDLEMASRRFELVLLLNREIVAYGPPELVLDLANLNRAFGGKVLMASGAIVVDECCPPDHAGERHA